jgi:hypothetical protein
MFCLFQDINIFEFHVRWIYFAQHGYYNVLDQNIPLSFFSVN